MPELSFSAPSLAIVAYCEVDGASGASTRLNSGIATSRADQGQYVIRLPTLLGQFEENDIVLVQPKNDLGGSGVVPKEVTVSELEFPVVGRVKQIFVYSGALAGGSTPPVETTSIDSTFYVLILRTTLPSMTGASPS